MKMLYVKSYASQYDNLFCLITPRFAPAKNKKTYLCKDCVLDKILKDKTRGDGIGDEDLVAHGRHQRSGRSPNLTFGGFGLQCHLKPCPVEHVRIPIRSFCKPEMKEHKRTTKITPKQNL